MTHPDDARDLYIHYALERAFGVLCAMRNVSRKELKIAMLRYMRGDGPISLSYAISNAFQAICEDPKITPQISMPDLFERVEAFIENDEPSPAVLEEVRA